MNRCRSKAMTAIVYDEKNALIAGQVRTMVHNTPVSVPKGQYFVRTPKRVMGMVNTQSVESATANVAIKMFRAVLISETTKVMESRLELVRTHVKCTHLETKSI